MEDYVDYKACLINIERPDELSISLVELVTREWELYGRDNAIDNSEHFVEHRDFLYHFLCVYNDFVKKGYYESPKRYVLKRNERGELYNSYEPVIEGIWMLKDDYNKMIKLSKYIHIDE